MERLQMWQAKYITTTFSVPSKPLHCIDTVNSTFSTVLFKAMHLGLHTLKKSPMPLP